MPGNALQGAQQIGTLPDGRRLVRVSCSTVPYESADGSQWAQVVPEGPFVQARDGRAFQISDALAVAAASELPLLVDWEHESESFCGSTEAAGWLEEIRVQLDAVGDFPRAGIWGRICWTAEGDSDVKGKVYRYLSPVLLLDAETSDVLQIVSVALTNRPALRMQGLDSYRKRFTAQYGLIGECMKPETLKVLLTALSLAEGAADDTILAAFDARIKADPSKETRELLSQQLGAANAEVARLNAEIEKARTASFAATVQAVLDQASKDGKIPPAARAGYEALCRTPEMFATFQADVLPNLVVIGAPAPRSAEKPAKTGAANEVFRSLKARGFTDEQIAAAVALPVNGADAEVED